MTTIPIKLLDPTVEPPKYATNGDAGADLVASEDASLMSGGTALVPTGIAVAIPKGYVGLVHPRSGLAAKKKVTVLNAPGTIDAGYRGEVKVILINHGDEHVDIRKGDRIAQLVIQKVEEADWNIVDELPDSVRGEGGFGSTGA